MTIANATAATAPATIAAPRKSGSRPCWSRLSRSSRRAGIRIGRPITRFTKNTAGQPSQLVRNPPRDGPVAAATAPVAVHNDVAVARCVTGNSGNARLSDVGSSTAPAIACTTRAATSTPKLPASPHTTDAVTNSTTPTRNRRLRPSRSASRPAGTSAAANTMLYALRTHDRSPSESCEKDRSMPGKAMLTIVTSSVAMNAATEVTINTCHRRGSHRRAPTCVIKGTLEARLSSRNHQIEPEREGRHRLHGARGWSLIGSATGAVDRVAQGPSFTPTPSCARGPGPGVAPDWRGRGGGRGSSPRAERVGSRCWDGCRGADRTGSGSRVRPCSAAAS